MSTVRAIDDESRVQPYDPLRQHEVIDRSQLRRLHPLLEACAHRMAGTLSTALRRPSRVVLGEFEQGPWDEFKAAMEDPTFVATAVVTELDERLLLHVPITTALSLVEVQLGGDGRTELSRAALTDLEFAMVSTTAANVLGALRASLDSVFEVNVTALQRYRSAHYVRMGRPGEAVFRVELTVTIGDGTTRPIWLYMPLGTVHTMLASVEQEEGDNTDVEAVLPYVERGVQEVPLELQVAYPPVHLSAAQVLALRPDDPESIVLLGVKTDEVVELDIIVGRTRIGKGVLVTNGKHAGCLVRSWERREE